MAERRSIDMVDFQLNLLLNGENPEALRQVGDSFHNFQMQDATFNLYPIQEAIETEVQQQEDSRNKEPNHGYRCTVNEEDFVSALLKDSSTEDEDQKQNDPQHKEEDRKGKRVRMEEDSSDSDLEDGRMIRQRLQILAVNEMEAFMERQGQGPLLIKEESNTELGLRQVVPQQPPKEP
ncbi:hypothetical protein COLO4_24955 [Corchorus olitorius]|uniref:Uncharacterized protein n=1 Tax=Corchorus olitorius TaxID=93759 RepID=A0A1R3I5S2_9ROSI|nr:hypothetical protein COLO4_24955 [Corchorus olitorius]